jgi:hypothetical protein
LKCLEMDDLNSIAICGRIYCYVRGHELLDQTCHTYIGGTKTLSF